MDFIILTKLKTFLFNKNYTRLYKLLKFQLVSTSKDFRMFYFYKSSFISNPAEYKFSKKFYKLLVLSSRDK